MDISEKLSKIALDLGAVTLNAKEPYTWASGYRMPIYNDNRLLLQDFETRALIAKGFSDVIKKENLNCNLIAGTSTSGIPHATTLADLLSFPLVYVRAKAKGHGLKNQIEGKLEKGDKCVLIEDVVSTGGSSIDTVTALRNEGAEVLACLSIFNYGFNKAADKFKEANCKLFSLFTFSSLTKVAKDLKMINNEEEQLLKKWGKSPFTWGEENGFNKVEKK